MLTANIIAFRWLGRKIAQMRLVEFGEALPAGTRVTLFSDDKPDRFFA